jgi:hypothetical protein
MPTLRSAGSLIRHSHGNMFLFYPTLMPKQILTSLTKVIVFYLSIHSTLFLIRTWTIYGDGAKRGLFKRPASATCPHYGPQGAILELDHDKLAASTQEIEGSLMPSLQGRIKRLSSPRDLNVQYIIKFSTVPIFVTLRCTEPRSQKRVAQCSIDRNRPFCPMIMMRTANIAFVSPCEESLSVYSVPVNCSFGSLRRKRQHYNSLRLHNKSPL